MPLIDAAFIKSDGTYDAVQLLRHGPTIQVIVGQLLDTKGAPQPSNLKSKTVPALVDTGAFSCMIDTQLANELGLIAVDKAMVAGVGGPKEHKIYMAGIVVPQLDINQFGRFLAADLKDGGQQCEVLLGRDFLSNTIMIYDGIRSQVTIASVKK